MDCKKSIKCNLLSGQKSLDLSDLTGRIGQNIELASLRCAELFVEASSLPVGSSVVLMLSFEIPITQII